MIKVAVHRNVPAQRHGVDDIVDGARVVAVLEANSGPQAGQVRQCPSRLRMRKQELDSVFISEAPVTVRQRCPAVHHPQRVISPGHDFPCVSVQGHCQVLFAELALLGVRKLGQLGERLPVFECGVVAQVEAEHPLEQAPREVREWSLPQRARSMSSTSLREGSVEQGYGGSVSLSSLNRADREESRRITHSRAARRIQALRLRRGFVAQRVTG